MVCDWSVLAIGVALIAYLFGSVPTGYWLGKALRGIDIREHGSRSTGATNVLRTLGKGPAVATLFVDLAKGYGAVAMVRWFLAVPFGQSWTPTSPSADAMLPWAMALAAFFAILGHSRSIWIGFGGGKSAATGLGALLSLSWEVGIGVLLVFAIMVIATRIVSLGSIAAALSAILLAVVLDQPSALILLTILGAAFVIGRHRTNIARLVEGSEPRLGHSKGSDRP
jgi:acyl phosphate:glycerol-3-phosphate acyltransferase